MLIQPSAENSVIEYDLDQVLLQIDDVWTWNFRYLQSTSFIFPEEVDLSFREMAPDERIHVEEQIPQFVREFFGSLNEYSKIIWQP